MFQSQRIFIRQEKQGGDGLSHDHANPVLTNSSVFAVNMYPLNNWLLNNYFFCRVTTFILGHIKFSTVSGNTVNKFINK